MRYLTLILFWFATSLWAATPVFGLYLGTDTIADVKQVYPNLILKKFNGTEGDIEEFLKDDTLAGFSSDIDLAGTVLGEKTVSLIFNKQGKLQVITAIFQPTQWNFLRKILMNKYKMVKEEYIQRGATTVFVDNDTIIMLQNDYQNNQILLSYCTRQFYNRTIEFMQQESSNEQYQLIY